MPNNFCALSGLEQSQKTFECTVYIAYIKLCTTKPEELKEIHYKCVIRVGR